MDILKYLFLFLLIFLRTNKADASDYSRRAAFSGSFYPDTKEELKLMITSFLDNVDKKVQQNDNIFGIISPHAGYIYSGQIAASAYKQLNPNKYKTVVIIGPSHSEYFDYIGIDNSKSWNNPLGDVQLDKKFISKLLKENKKIKIYPRPHTQEHSLEVQVPFLQEVLTDFKIVPIIIGTQTEENCKSLSDALINLIKDRDDVLIVASTDLSHFHSKGKAEKLDQMLLKDIKQFKAKEVLEGCDKRDYEACGAGPIAVLLYMAQEYENRKIELLKYGTSYDTSGDDLRVVGYSSFLLFKDIQPEEGILNKKQSKFALRIVRETIEHYLEHKKKKDFKIDESVFQEEYGAFVTLRLNTRLRGCIGHIIGTMPLWKTIRDMALAAAFQDTRFQPVTLSEFKDIHIDVSILSKLERVKSADDIILGKHGVVVKRGMYQGVFLPEVATETGWTKEEFLNHLCKDKAYLQEDAWKDKDTELHVFTTQIIEE